MSESASEESLNEAKASTFSGEMIDGGNSGIRIRTFKRTKFYATVSIICVAALVLAGPGVNVYNPEQITIDVNTLADNPYFQYLVEKDYLLDLVGVSADTILLVTFEGLEPPNTDFGAYGKLDDRVTGFVFTLKYNAKIPFSAKNDMKLLVQKVETGGDLRIYDGISPSCVTPFSITCALANDFSLKGYTYSEGYNWQEAENEFLGEYGANLIIVPTQWHTMDIESSSKISYYSVGHYGGVSQEVSRYGVVDNDRDETAIPIGTTKIRLKSPEYGDLVMRIRQTTESAVYNLAPTANAGLDRTADIGETIKFDASRSVDWDGQIIAYAWSFDDGNTGSGMYAVHSFAESGTYNATLAVTDDLGGMGYDNVVIYVPNDPPVVQAGPDMTLEEDEWAWFNGTATDTPSDIPELDYEWDFGDRTVAHWQDSVHRYERAGDYVVMLIVTDDEGGIGFDHLNVTVVNIPPVADAGIDIVAIEDETVIFDSSGTFDTPSDLESLDYSWDFGDGSRGSGAKPGHAYTRSGTYLATLTVFDDNGESDSDSVMVAVLNDVPNAVADSMQTNPYMEEGTVAESFVLVLDASDSSDTPSDEPLLGYDWDFGAGGMQPTYSWPDDGLYPVALMVNDDDGAVSGDGLDIEVKNLAPMPAVTGAYQIVDITLRASGEKWHDVELAVFDGYDTQSLMRVTRTPGSPDDQSVRVEDVRINIAEHNAFEVYYTPFDDPVNGQVNGATPVWVTLEFEDFTSATVHNTFNVQNPEGWTWNVVVNQYLMGKPIHFEASVFDFGADDITLTWDFGDGTKISRYFKNDGSHPVQLEDTTTHTYVPNSGMKVLVLTAKDHDGGVGTDAVFIENDVELFADSIAPKAFAGDDLQGFEDESISFKGSAEDTLSDIPKLKYIWDFGLETYGWSIQLEQDVTHGFAKSGTYLVSLNVLDDTNDLGIDAVKVDIVNKPPIAHFSHNPATVNEDTVVSFDAHLSSDTPSDLPLLQYSWDFGDGSKGYGIMADHVYTNSGIYTVMLTVTDDNGASSVDVAAITVSNLEPSASIGGDLVVSEDQMIFFDAVGSDTPSDLPMLDYSWDFGDGSVKHGKHQTYTYTNAGTYAISLTVSDGDAQSTETIEVNVYNSPPTADAGHDRIIFGDTVTLTGFGFDNVSDIGTLSYEWDFGDGSYGYGPVQSHTYAFSGNYVVTLNVTDDNGESDIDTLSVMIYMDSDGDGMLDQWELKYGLNPNSFDPPNSDDDGDGLLLHEEYYYDTNPYNKDSDGDDLWDGEEVNTYHTNPASNDTDDDMLIDSTEMVGHYYYRLQDTNHYFSSTGVGNTPFLMNNIYPDGDYNITIYGHACINPHYSYTSPPISAQDELARLSYGINVSMDTQVDSTPMNYVSDVTADNSYPSYCQSIGYYYDYDSFDIAYHFQINITSTISSISIAENISAFTVAIQTGTPPLTSTTLYLLQYHIQLSHILIERGTNPYIQDIDYDGLEDGFEVIHGLNPVIEDSDNDNFWDGAEIAFWTEEIGLDTIQAAANALNSDTDSDLLLDGSELTDTQLRTQTNPHDRDSDDDMIRDGSDPNPLIFNDGNGNLMDIDAFASSLNLDVIVGINYAGISKAEPAIFVSSASLPQLPGQVGPAYEFKTSSHEQFEALIKVKIPDKSSYFYKDKRYLLMYYFDGHHWTLFKHAVLGEDTWRDVAEEYVWAKTSHFTHIAIADSTENDMDGDGLTDGEELNVAEYQPQTITSFAGGNTVNFNSPVTKYISIPVDPGSYEEVTANSYVDLVGKAEWSNEVRVSPWPLEDWRPNIVVDSDDNIHMLWQRNGGSPTYWDIWYAKVNRFGVFLENPKRIVNDTGGSVQHFPQMVVDSTGKLHIAWSGAFPEGIFYKQLDSGGNPSSWTLPISFSIIPTSKPDTAHVPVIDIDDSDTIHVAWTQLYGSNWAIYYKKLSGYSILISKKISNQDLDSQHAYFPEIATDIYKNAHIIWNDESQDNIYYARVNDAGDVDVGPKSLTSSDSLASTYYDITTDSNGKVHIVWKDLKDGHIYYMKLKNNGDLEINPTKISNRNFAYDPSIVVDSNDCLWVTWRYLYTNPTGAHYMKLDNNGNQLEDEEQIPGALGGVPALDSQDFLHYAWVDVRNGPLGEIYYTNNRLFPMNPTLSIWGGVNWQYAGEFISTARIDDSNIVTAPTCASGAPPFACILNTHLNAQSDQTGVNSIPFTFDSDQGGIIDLYPHIEVVPRFSDPFEGVDNDGDGLDDTSEDNFFFNSNWFELPSNPDIDGDWIPNGMDDPDSDGDGLLDGEEVYYNSSWFMIDSDGDGLLDGDNITISVSDSYNYTRFTSENIYNIETPQGSGVYEFVGERPYGSAPYSSDTDNDGLGDLEEVKLGTSPAKEDTDDDRISDYLDRDPTSQWIINGWIKGTTQGREIKFNTVQKTGPYAIKQGNSNIDDEDGSIFLNLIRDDYVNVNPKPTITDDSGNTWELDSVTLEENPTEGGALCTGYYAGKCATPDDYEEPAYKANLNMEFINQQPLQVQSYFRTRFDFSEYSGAGTTYKTIQAGKSYSFNIQYSTMEGITSGFSYTAYQKNLDGTLSILHADTVKGTDLDEYGGRQANLYVPAHAAVTDTVLEITPVWVDVTTDHSYPLNPYDVDMRFASFEMYTFNGAMVAYLKPNVDIDAFENSIPPDVLDYATGYYTTFGLCKSGPCYVYVVNATNTDVNILLRQKSDHDNKAYMTYEKYLRFSRTSEFEDWEVHDVHIDEELGFVAEKGKSTESGNPEVSAVVLIGNDPVEISKVLAGPLWNISWRARKSIGPVAVIEDPWVDTSIFTSNEDYTGLAENMLTTIGSARLRFLVINNYGSGSVIRANKDPFIVDIPNEDTLVLQRYEQADLTASQLIYLQTEYLFYQSKGYVKTSLTQPPIYDIGERVFDVVSEVIGKKAKLSITTTVVNKLEDSVKYDKLKKIIDEVGIGLVMFGTAERAYGIWLESQNVGKVAYVIGEGAVAISSIIWDEKVLLQIGKTPLKFGRLAPLILGIMESIYFIVEQNYQKAAAAIIDGSLLTYSLGAAAIAEAICLFVTWIIFGEPMSLGDVVVFIGGWISHFIFGTDPPTLPSNDIDKSYKLHFYEENWVFIKPGG